ncbi:MAG: glutamate 5-kinase, partial [Actinobacteria bacterium]|nr:glutamate 5-kinase [Actinomycetota bacterium]
MMRSEVTRAKRIVVKVGSSSLTGSAGAGLDSGAVDRLVDAVASAKARGLDVLVVTSGAIAAGLAPLGLKSRPKELELQQAAASVGQGLLMHRYTESFARHSITASQVLLTSEDIVRRSHYRNAQRTLDRLLSLGVVPVVNENDTVGTSEIRFGDNDRLAALVSHLVQADLLILLSDIDALYDAPPTSQHAKRIAEVSDFAALASAEIGGAGSGAASPVGSIDPVGTHHHPRQSDGRTRAASPPFAHVAESRTAGPHRSGLRPRCSAGRARSAQGAGRAAAGRPAQQARRASWTSRPCIRDDCRSRGLSSRHQDSGHVAATARAPLNEDISA